MSILSLLPQVEGGEKRKKGSVTWKLENGRASRKIDGQESLLQAAELSLTVPRYRYAIYSWNYGSELETLIGQPFDEIRKKAPAFIREALLQDDRISDAGDFTVFPAEGSDGADIAFTLYTALGNLRQETVVG